ncbi:MAG: ARMT1-like domain-containing protein [Desulfurococcaceae archaeon]
MKPDIECLRCIVSTRLREIGQLNLDKEEKLKLSKEIIAKITEYFNWDIELTELASEVFKYLVSKAPQVADQYKITKRALNEIALKNKDIHEQHIKLLHGYSKFKYLVKLSAIGNLLDYGVADHKPLDKPITPVMVEEYEIAVDDSHRLYELLKNGGIKITWLFDNAGEAVYDMLLINEIRKMGNTVFGLVKNEPGFQNDISAEDADHLDLRAYLDDIKTYGCRCSTIHLDHISYEARSLIERSDLIVAKGMSHFEYLSEVNIGKPVCFILIPKCDPVARRIRENSRGKIVVLLKQ